MKRQARKRSLTTRLSTTKSTDRLERETRKLVSKANARLDSLQRRYKSGTWASKKLANRLSANKMKMWSKSGKIKIGKSLTKSQMVGLNKAINQFLLSATSTKKGIKSVREKTIESLRGTLSDDIEEMSYEDAEKFYEMFGNNDFQTLADKIGSSALQACIEDAIESGDSEEDFIKRLEWYGGVSMNDLDIREAAQRLYEKYVL
ncbi:hypothetical protein [Fusobacterium ulcerans]|uniref:hypothetical protein n=1 Tax=Fusobacterium ulcerans TaxID=861 RepID=UPI002E79BA04|nr:hypothetical protein [Fusobacterium ulcerans]MEE0137737.1 hypothetical protein [Fusobacterium ulcerans]